MKIQVRFIKGCYVLQLIKDNRIIAVHYIDNIYDTVDFIVNILRDGIINFFSNRSYNKRTCRVVYYKRNHRFTNDLFTEKINEAYMEALLTATISLLFKCNENQCFTIIY